MICIYPLMFKEWEIKSSPGTRYFSPCTLHKPLRIHRRSESGKVCTKLSLPFISYTVAQNKIQSCSAKHTNSLKLSESLGCSCCYKRFLLCSENRIIKQDTSGKEFSTSYLGKWVTQHFCSSSFTNDATCRINWCSEEGSVIAMCRISGT